MTNKNKSITIRMPEEEIKVFIDYADKNDLNKSAFIRRAIKELLEKK
ncbi:putative DNA binding CopG/RHH family protein [Neobacillus niacini]|nr:DUF6290 family protein [Neobacillus niacini]MDQ0975863.1 putative DNA binding CopG/RHH family protein [Neobacillus niacini]